MAFDLLRIAPEREVPPFKPAWLLWFVLFFAIVGGIGFSVMLFWPTGQPTQTLGFWVAVAVLPIVCWLGLFLWYLGALQAACSDAEHFNAVRRGYIASVCRKAGEPLRLLATGFVFSAQEQENTVAAIVDRELMLGQKMRFFGDDMSVMARWLNPVGSVWLPGTQDADKERHRQLLSWVFESLLRKILPALHALPAATLIRVQLHIASELAQSEVERIWQKNWTSFELKKMVRPGFLVDAPNLNDVDVWLDHKGSLPADAITLLCIVQLNFLLETPPDAGSAEAGVILLIASPTLTEIHAVNSSALLYRPELRDERALGQGLLQALLWSKTSGQDVLDQWLTGGSEIPLQRALNTCLEEHEVGVLGTTGQHDLDLRIGHAGVAAPWLSVVLAAAHAASSGQKQLLSLARADQMTLAVVAPPI